MRKMKCENIIMNFRGFNVCTAYEEFDDLTGYTRLYTCYWCISNGKCEKMKKH